MSAIIVNLNPAKWPLTAHLLRTRFAWRVAQLRVHPPCHRLDHKAQHAAEIAEHTAWAQYLAAWDMMDSPMRCTCECFPVCSFDTSPCPPLEGNCA